MKPTSGASATNKVKDNVEANVDASVKARESSNFREHVNKEREVNALDVGSANKAGNTTGKGTGATSDTLEGLNKPVRPVNTEFPPNQTVADALVSDRFKNLAKCSGMDCSEIAEKLLDVAGGKGKIIEVRPKNKGQLNVFENGRIEPGQYYHQVYTDGKYIYALVCHRNQYQKVIGRNILK